jgi:hypothetical protein
MQIISAPIFGDILNRNCVMTTINFTLKIYIYMQDTFPDELTVLFINLETTVIVNNRNKTRISEVLRWNTVTWCLNKGIKWLNTINWNPNASVSVYRMCGTQYRSPAPHIALQCENYDGSHCAYISPIIIVSGKPLFKKSCVQNSFT